MADSAMLGTGLELSLYLRKLVLYQLSVLVLSSDVLSGTQFQNGRLGHDRSGVLLQSFCERKEQHAGGAGVKAG